MNHTSVDLYGDLFESCANSNGQANAKNNNNCLPASFGGGGGGEIPTPATDLKEAKSVDSNLHPMDGGLVGNRTTFTNYDNVFLDEILSLDSHRDILLQQMRKANQKLEDEKAELNQEVIALKKKCAILEQNISGLYKFAGHELHRQEKDLSTLNFRLQACETAYGKERIDKLVLMRTKGVDLGGYEENPFQYKFLPHFQKPGRKIDKYYRWYYERWAILKNQKLRTSRRNNGPGNEPRRGVREFPVSNDRFREDSGQKEQRNISRKLRNGFLKDGIGSSNQSSDEIYPKISEIDSRTSSSSGKCKDNYANDDCSRPSVEDRKLSRTGSSFVKASVEVKHDDSPKDKNSHQTSPVELKTGSSGQHKGDQIQVTTPGIMNSSIKGNLADAAAAIGEKVEEQEVLGPKNFHPKILENPLKDFALSSNVKGNEDKSKLKESAEEIEDVEIKSKAQEQKQTIKKGQISENPKHDNEMRRETCVGSENSKSLKNDSFARRKDESNINSACKENDVSRSSRKYDRSEDNASQKESRRNSPKYKDRAEGSDARDRPKRYRSRSRSAERRRRRSRSRSRERKRHKRYNSPEKTRQYNTEKSRKYSPVCEKRYNYDQIVVDYRKRRLKSKTPYRSRHLKYLQRERTISRQRDRSCVSRAKRGGRFDESKRKFDERGARPEDERSEVELKTRPEKQLFKVELKTKSSYGTKDHSKLLPSPLNSAKKFEKEIENKSGQSDELKEKRNEDNIENCEGKCSRNYSKTKTDVFQIGENFKGKNSEEIACVNNTTEVEETGSMDKVDGDIPRPNTEPVVSDTRRELLKVKVDATQRLSAENIGSSRNSCVAAPSALAATYFNLYKMMNHGGVNSDEKRNVNLKKPLENSPEVSPSNENRKTLVGNESTKLTPKEKVSQKQKDPSETGRTAKKVDDRRDGSESDKENCANQPATPKLKSFQLMQIAERPALCVLPCLESPRLQSNDVLSSILHRMKDLGQKQKDPERKTFADSNILKTPRDLNKSQEGQSSRTRKEYNSNINDSQTENQLKWAKTESEAKANCETKNIPMLQMANFDPEDFSNELLQSYQDSCSVIAEIDSFLQECLQLDNFLKLGRTSFSRQMESKEKPNWNRWKEWKQKCDGHDTSFKKVEKKPKLKLEDRSTITVVPACASKIFGENSADNMNPRQFCDVQIVELRDEDAFFSDAFVSDGTIISGDVDDTQSQVVTETSQEFFSEEAMFNLTTLEEVSEGHIPLKEIESSEDNNDFEDVNIGKLVLEMETVLEKSSVIEPSPEQLDVDSESEWFVNSHKNVSGKRKRTSKTKLRIDSSENDDNDGPAKQKYNVSPSEELTILVEDNSSKLDENGNVVLGGSGNKKPRVSDLSTSSFATSESSGMFSESSSKSSNSVASFRQKVISGLKRSKRSGKWKYCKPIRKIKDQKKSSFFSNSYSELQTENVYNYFCQQSAQCDAAETDQNKEMVTIDGHRQNISVESDVELSDEGEKVSEECHDENLESCNDNRIENPETSSESDEDFDDPPMSPEIGRKSF